MKRIAARNRERRWVTCAVVFGAGVALRLFLFSGYGLGDDVNYFTSFHSIYRSGTYNPSDPYAMRFGIWVPVVLSMKLLGVTEAGFVGAITACSIVNLVLVYLLARQEWEPRYALLAMALLAVFPLDVLSSTLFANDIILATYCFTALWLYRKALRTPEPGAPRVLSAAGAGVFLAFGFVTKPWVVLLAPLLGAETLRHGRAARQCAVVTGGAVALLVGGYVGWQWWRFGNPLYHIDLARSSAIFLPYSRDILLDYPRMLFLRNEYGSRFAGLYPHALVVLALLFALRVGRAGRWLAYTAVLVLGLAALPTGRVNGRWMTLVPHIFRYLCLISIPLCLALAAYLRELFRYRATAGALVTASLLIAGLVESAALTEPSRDAFGEERRAITVLGQFPDEQVWSDHAFLGRFQNFALQARRFDLTHPILSENAQGRARELADVAEGMVVTGGGRLPWYGCWSCIPDLGSTAVPPSWTLVSTFAGKPLTFYRHEPLRIWHVSRAAETARQLLADRGDVRARRALFQRLVDRGGEAPEVVVEVGRQLCEERPDDMELAYLTGVACARAGKVGCATRGLSAALAAGLPDDRAREALRLLAMTRERAADYEQAYRWIAERRRRFPALPMDPILDEIDSGMPEAVARYQERNFVAAEQMFTTIANRPSNPDRERRALYFLALTLFRMGNISEAVSRADLYRARYGEDPGWVELRYRHGVAARPIDSRTAREAFRDVLTRFPKTPWAKEAEGQLNAMSYAGG